MWRVNCEFWVACSRDSVSKTICDVFFLNRGTRTKRITNCYFLNVALCTRFVQCERWQGSLCKPHAVLSVTHTCIQVPFCWVWLKTCYCKPFSKCYIKKLEALRPRGSVVCSTAVLCVVTQRSSLHDDPKNRRLFRPCLKTFVAPFFLTGLTTPDSPRMEICYKIDLYLPNSLQSRKLFNSLI